MSAIEMQAVQQRVDQELKAKRKQSSLFWQVTVKNYNRHVNSKC